eukprot:CAMPEP_0175088646 /NCGR_PEP_ID=MMETSP0086_2-20121207/356_1 /TAXON_ID=136419 /ORGANISM="Unknown Unknown, Strain D1" /LENGTH=975 /DNA_ID=CAMNT_0016361087 /DNA_START=444 /DNA_END=3371 /DNA_ORIENTATION=-
MPPSFIKCPATGSCIKFSWSASGFPACPVQCGMQSVQLKQVVICAGDSGQIGRDEDCSSISKPAEVKFCPATAVCSKMPTGAPLLKMTSKSPTEAQTQSPTVDPTPLPPTQPTTQPQAPQLSSVEEEVMKEDAKLSSEDLVEGLKGQFKTKDGLFSLRWEEETNQGRPSIKFVLSAKVTSRWLSIGLSERSAKVGHVNMDTITCFFDDPTLYPSPATLAAISSNGSDGVVKCVDGFSNDKREPDVDQEQSVLEGSIAGSQVDGEMTVQFSRLLSTGDQDDVAITAQVLLVSWAIGMMADPIFPHSTVRNEGYGSLSVNLLSSEPAVVEGEGMDPGQLLSVVVALCLSTVGLVHWLKLFIKRNCKGWIHLKILYSIFQRKTPCNDPAILSSHTEPAMRGHSTNPKVHQNLTSFAIVPGKAGSSSRVSQSSQARLKMPICYSNDDVEAALVLADLQREIDIVMPPSLPPLPPPSLLPPNKSDENFFPVCETQKPIPKTIRSRGQVLRRFVGARIPQTQFSVFQLWIFAGYISINILFLFHGTNYRDVKANLGYLAAANSLFVALPATRNSVLTTISGLPFDQLIAYHRWLGRWLIGLVTAHMVGYWVSWYTSAEDVLRLQLDKRKNLMGFGAWVAGIVILLTSFGCVRRKHWTWFFYTHFSFFFFYAFAWFHSPQKMPVYIISAAAAYGLDRLIRFFWGLKIFRTSSLRVVDGNVVAVRIPKHAVADALGLQRVGQYVFVNFPAISPFAWHPFSISSGPREKCVELHIRALGDYTSRLLAAARRNSSLLVRVDGPYGNHRFNYRRYHRMILVAGGVGITPLLGIVRDLFNIGDLEKDRPVPGHCIERVHLIWVLKTAEEFCWFKEDLLECLSRVTELAGTRRSSPFPEFHISTFVSQASSQAMVQATIPAVCGPKTGRPDMASVFREIESTDSASDRLATVVFACGPRGLVNASWDETVKRNKKGARFDFHFETFEF